MTGSEIREKLKKIWKHLRQIWLWDSKGYATIDLDTLKKIVANVKDVRIILPSGEEIRYGDLRNVGEQFDCDDIAIGGEFLAKLIWLYIARGSPPIAFGSGAGDKFSGFSGGHKLNVSIASNRIYLVDFGKGGEIWEADPETDSVFFVSM